MKMFKKLMMVLGAAAMLTACASSTPAATTVEEEPAKVSDAVIQDYLDADVKDVKISYQLEDGSMSKWAPMYNDSAAVQNIVNEFNEAAKTFFTTTELTPVDEKEINAKELVFIIQAKPQENIYFYKDGHLKTVSMDTRDFYELPETTLIDGVTAIADAVVAAQAE